MVIHWCGLERSLFSWVWLEKEWDWLEKECVRAEEQKRRSIHGWNAQRRAEFFRFISSHTSLYFKPHLSLRALNVLCL